MSNLVILKGNEALTTSLIIAEKLNRTHKGIIQIIRRYKIDFVEFGTLEFETSKSKGRPTEFVYLNEQHLTFLLMILRIKKEENDKVLEFKKKITKEFFNMRKFIIENKEMKESELYIEARNESKAIRKEETDIIKVFVEYAKKQGSKSADKYYMNFSRMENNAFFIIKDKFPNVRGILNINQLSKIKIADMIIKQAIVEGIENEMYYKDIFKLAKERIINLSNSLGIKEIIPNIEFKQIEVKNE
jgi:phage regulator Rha-like protein